MGHNNGKPESSEAEDYFQLQLDYFKWRANPCCNTDICRVFISSKNTLLHREKLQSLLNQQLNKKSYVDVEQILKLSKHSPSNSQNEEVMTFETYLGQLGVLVGRLSLEENLYVLQALLRGYQVIFQKLGKAFIGLQCCFLTENGQIRAWFNPNYMSNELPILQKTDKFAYSKCDQGESQLQSSEIGIVRQILKLSQQLSSNPTAYLHFLRQLRVFTSRDILHNFNFSSVRKFINGYIYTYRLVIPADLSQITKRQMNLHSACSTPNKMTSSLAQLIEDTDYLSKIKLLPTGANLELVSRLKKQEKQNQMRTVSYSEYSGNSKKEFQFYRPAGVKKMHEKKTSNVDLNRVKQKQKLLKHLSRSEMISKQSLDRSQQINMSNSFSKKDYYEQINSNLICQSLTPNKQSVRTKNNMLDSTAMYSQFTHSKEPSKFNESKTLQQSYTTVHFNEPVRASKTKLQKRSNLYKYANFCQEEKEGRQKQNKIVVMKEDDQLIMNQQKKWNPNPHQKQPSFDQNSSAIFIITPPNQPINFQSNTPKSSSSSNDYSPYQKSHFHFKQSQVDQQQEESVSGPFSTTGQKSFSKNINRQLSGLVSNLQHSICESVGSFISVQQSSASQYKGMLTKMGRSAKMVTIPSNKRVQVGFKSAHNGPHLTR